MSLIRNPAQAGRFYPENPVALQKEVKKYIIPAGKKKKAIGIVAPHAGYIYSGKAAGIVFSNIEIPGTVIILGPNHTGAGHDTAIMSSGEWAMPGGSVKINSELALDIISASGKLIKEGIDAHLYEHSIEVQLPFLQYFKKEFRIVPICMRDYSYKTCRGIAQSITKAVKRRKDILIIASSDMSHYEPQETAEEKDKIAIDEILKLSPEGFLDTVSDNNISMCGSGPIAAMLYAAKELGAKNAELLVYNTSGDTSGDYSSVVGYAGIIVE